MNEFAPSPEVYRSKMMESDSSESAPSLRQDWSYELTVHKVEEIMTRIEAGELELAQVFDQFAEAVEYLHQCEQFLSQRQKQIDLIIETLSEDAEF